MRTKTRKWTVDGQISTLTDSQRKALSQDGWVKKAGSTISGIYPLWPRTHSRDTRYINVEHGATGTGLEKRGLVGCKRHRGRFTSGLTNDWYLTEFGEEVRDALRSVFADPRIDPKVIGPRRVGGRYLCGYWGREYTVTAIEYKDDWRGTSITCLWAPDHDNPDGHTNSHGTPWEEGCDKVLDA